MGDLGSGGLGSAPVPLPGADGVSDHLRGRAEDPLLVLYTDFECPFCAVVHATLRTLAVRVCGRHFPVRSPHPRGGGGGSAAEAAGRQGRFWEMHDALFADPARLEDPHLWERARALGLDVARFDADRRGEPVLARVRRDFASGVRAGVVSTPALFLRDAGGSFRSVDRAAVAARFGGTLGDALP